MTKSLYLFALMLVIFSSCAKNKVVVPEGMIPRDSMIVILAEMHLVEATIQSRNLGRNDTTRLEAFGRYKYLLAKHKITEVEFKKSFEFYRSEPEYFLTMYNDIITRLSELQAKDALTK